MARLVAGALQRARAPEPAPRRALSLGVEANSLTDREPLVERDFKTKF